MRSLGITAVLLVGLPAPAAAFHHHGQYQAAADGREEVPGSGGLYYTGSRRDLGLRCSHCHTEAPGRVRADVDFAPALSAGAWAPGTTYRVTVTMRNENAGLSGCGTTPNRNGIAAMLVGPSGFPVGQVRPDAGGRQCGSRFVNPPIGQTTVVFGDCEGVVGAQSGNASYGTWRFDWVAPAAGTGEVTLWLGVVDGSCEFDAFDDDVYETQLAMSDLSMARVLRSAPAAPDGVTLARAEVAVLPERLRV